MLARLGWTRWLWLVALALFYGYTVLLVVAGAWGAFGGAELDQGWLFDLDVDQLEERTTATLVSQYRFLRAIEVGFGVFALRYRHEIFADPRFGRPFVIIMLLGVLARAEGWLLEGRPSALFLFFLFSEAAGVVTIWLVARVRWTDHSHPAAGL